MYVGHSTSSPVITARAFMAPEVVRVIIGELKLA